MNKVELLAPAGSMESMMAAVNAGANAVYLGGKSFGARRSAQNFDDQALIEAIRYCHRRGVAVYITVNTLIKNNEMSEALAFIAFLFKIDADAVIVQDLGLIYEIRKHFPDLPCHASTQMTLHSHIDVDFAESIGLERVVLSRELSFDEVKEIRDSHEMMLEIFAHGALCVSYSGQCLFSSHIGGRSGNRGACAQPCRKSYQLETMGGKKVSNNQQVYLLSPKDLRTYDHISDLRALSPISLKIEGRMKSPEYVYAVVNAYRNALDGHMLAEDADAITRAFNRQFTAGHLFNATLAEFINTSLPSHHGTLLGKVISCKSGYITVRLMDNITMGDEIQIRFPGKTIGGRVEKLFRGEQTIKEASVGDTVTINFKHHVKPHSMIYKTYDVKYLENIKTLRLTSSAPYGLELKFEGGIGSPAILTAIDENGNKIVTHSEQNIEKALNRPLDEMRILEQLSKLGGTLYFPIGIIIDFPSDGTLSISQINQMRRETIDALMTERENWHHRDIAKADRLSNITVHGNKHSGDAHMKTTQDMYQFHAHNEEQLQLLLKSAEHQILCHDLEAITLNLEACIKGNIIPVLPSIIRNETWPSVYDFLSLYTGACESKNTSPVIAINHIAHHLLSERYPSLKFIYDQGCQIMNTSTLALIEGFGDAKAVVLSPELSMSEIEALDTDHTPDKISLGYQILGHLQLMKTSYCPIGGTLAGKNHCGLCANEQYYLVDDMNHRYPIICNVKNCHTVILSEYAINEMTLAKRLKKSGIDFFAIDFLGLSKEQCQQILMHLSDADLATPFENFKTVRGYLKKGIE